LNLIIKPKSPEIDLSDDPPPKKEAPEAPKINLRGNHHQLRSDYVFETYVVGDNNSFAANAAQVIARIPGRA
jgi:chromosomal replication initiator protein